MWGMLWLGKELRMMEVFFFLSLVIMGMRVFVVEVVILW